MDPTIPTPTVCSTVSNSEVSMQAPPPSPLHILEISLISAQDLTPVSKAMRTYAVAYTHPSGRKLTTRTDQQGHTHPTWNEKLTFRVDGHFLTSEDSAIHIEIYSTASWFREVLVGTIRVLISDLLYPDPLATRRMRFVTLQVRRPSGAPQGILNMGVSLSRLGDEFRNALEQKVNALSLEDRGNDDNDNERKITLWRSLSVGSEADPGSVVNGGSSMVNGGSELCSDIGPSASIVAADLAKKCQPLPPPQQQPMIRRPSGYEETGSSILGEMTMEEAKAKGYRVRSSRERWRKQVSKRDYVDMYDDRSDLSSDCNAHSRRNSDGGMFSCFGTAYGIEFRIVCGAPNNPTTKRLPSSSSNNNSLSKKNIKLSDANSA